MNFTSLFSILQMLGIVTNVFGHQESIAPISSTLNANNGWFKVDLVIIQHFFLYFKWFCFFKYMSIWCSLVVFNLFMWA